jgi:hypothetical protein
MANGITLKINQIHSIVFILLSLLNCKMPYIKDIRI